MIIFLYYFLKDGPQIIRFIREFLPLKKKHQNHLISKTFSTIQGVLYGQVFTSFMQGLIGALIFYLLGLPSPIFWGAIMMLFAIIPIGTWVVWLPAAINLILTGVSWGTPSTVWKGIILIILGVGVISTIDNILKPLLIKKKIELNIGIIMLSLFGGLFMFGFVGIFVGPLIITLLLATFEIYREMKHETKK